MSFMVVSVCFVMLLLKGKCVAFSSLILPVFVMRCLHYFSRMLI